MYKELAHQAVVGVDVAVPEAAGIFFLCEVVRFFLEMAERLPVVFPVPVPEKFILFVSVSDPVAFNTLEVADILEPLILAFGLDCFELLAMRVAPGGKPEVLSGELAVGAVIRPADGSITPRRSRRRARTLSN